MGMRTEAKRLVYLISLGLLTAALAWYAGADKVSAGGPACPPEICPPIFIPAVFFAGEVPTQGPTTTVVPPMTETPTPAIPSPVPNP